MKRLDLSAAIVAIVLTSSCVAVAAESSDNAPCRLTLGRAFACCDYGGRKIALVDAEGKITWQYPAIGAQDIWILPSGNILFSHVKGAKEITRQKEVVWEYETDPKNEVHACQPLPDGLVMIAESGPMQIIEVNREGRITKTIKLTSEIERTHSQMRGARKLANGNYLVGQYGDAVVREYSPTGKIVRDIPHKQAFSGLRLPNGNTLIATGDSHRILEVDPAGKTVWSIEENELPGNPLRFVAGMQRLPNGNTLVCNWGGHGHVGQQPQVFEVTRDKTVVGEIYDFQQFGTLTSVFVLDVEGDPTRFEILS
jgi:hypothetical protein